jgi:hypothetical protein
MAEETRMLDTLAQTLAVDSVPPTRQLTRDDLQEIAINLQRFEDALEDSGDAGKSRHCLVLTGYLGSN